MPYSSGNSNTMLINNEIATGYTYNIRNLVNE